ncbi:hypothetical protein TorRG33x02_211430 [Trema orientale]|uniref:Uncharacterized protein n=1 Tax=Trema orientale TaxID=63057 RepID=A0A2P5EBZ5_TREOI|nr:hypothetical protein TorRG33x02_211430 [Trema orientale]
MLSQPTYVITQPFAPLVFKIQSFNSSVAKYQPSNPMDKGVNNESFTEKPMTCSQIPQLQQALTTVNTSNKKKQGELRGGNKNKRPTLQRQASTMVERNK